MECPHPASQRCDLIGLLGGLGSRCRGLGAAGLKYAGLRSTAELITDQAKLQHLSSGGL